MQVPPEGELFRLAIDRSFTLEGIGTVVTGTVRSGHVAAGDEVAWLPGGKTLRVRGVQSHGSDVEAARRGQRAAADACRRGASRTAAPCPNFGDARIRSFDTRQPRSSGNVE